MIRAKMGSHLMQLSTAKDLYFFEGEFFASVPDQSNAGAAIREASPELKAPIAVCQR